MTLPATQPIGYGGTYADRHNRMVWLAREDFSAFVELVMRHEQTGKPVVQAEHHLAWADMANAHDRLVLWAAVEHGKALAIDTPIPTPSGWTSMGDLKIGDTVFGRDGKPCSVTFVTPVQYNHQVYRVRFDDGAELVADAEHRWLVGGDEAQRRVKQPKGVDGTGRLCACGCGLHAAKWKQFVHNHHGRKINAWDVRTTAEMLAAGLRKGKGKNYRWRIPLSAPLQMPLPALPIHPYVLGVWLGDGNSNGPVITMHESDRFIGDRCAELEGGRATWARGRKNQQVMQVRLGSALGQSKDPGPQPWKLSTRLRELGLLQNKHIPQVYLSASIEQRMELLAGLLDTDGSVEPKRGCAEFANTNARLASDVVLLLRGLGFKPSSCKTKAKLHGREIGDCYRIQFTPRVPVFKLPRKLARQKLGEPFGRSRYRCVVAIEPVPSVPVRCIGVDSPDHTYVAGRDLVVTHNTVQQSIARPLWLIGRDPNIRIAVVSANDAQAKKIVHAMKQYIENSAAYHAVFPHIAPSDLWAEHRFSVRRPFISKDPTVQATGMGGNITGSRVDLLILDDVLTWENTRTPEQREKVWQWYHSSNIGGRITERGRVLVVGTAFHPSDLLHRLARLPGWVAKRTPVFREDGVTPRWPEAWPIERILRRKSETTPDEFARQFLCHARDDATAIFKRDWIERGLRRGLGRTMAHRLMKLPDGFATYTGVDLAVSQKDSADKTVLFTILVHPNESREVLEVKSGRWAGEDIIRRIIDVHQRFNSIVMVEGNAAQDFIVQAVQHRSAVPVRSFVTTGFNKNHPEFGVQSLAAEHANGKWIIPSADGLTGLSTEVNAWIDEMVDYAPTDHTGDHLMASWFAREAARQGVIKSRTGFLPLSSR